MHAKLSKVVQGVAFERYTASINAAPDAGGPETGPGRPVPEGVASHTIANAPQRKMAETRATACLRVRPVGTAYSTSAAEFVHMNRTFVGVEP